MFVFLLVCANIIAVDLLFIVCRSVTPGVLGIFAALMLLLDVALAYWVKRYA